MTNQAAQTMHPDALPDGTLSKSTAERVTALAAASVSERARELLGLIDRYWDLAYAEGKEGRTHDTENGDAQECRYEIEKAIRALSESPAAASVPDGMVLAPREPTEAMIDAAWECDAATDWVGEHKRIHSATEAWNAMLSAASGEADHKQNAALAVGGGE